MITQVRDWGFIVLKMDGDGLAAEMQQSLDAFDKAGDNPEAHVVVRAEQQGQLRDFVVQQHLVSLGPPVLAPILDAPALTQFVSDTMQRFPAQHWCVLVDGHSHDVRRHIPALHQALQGHPIDLLVFDSCYMAQIEAASEFADVAHYLVASEEAVAGSRPVEDVVRHLPMAPAQVASEMVRSSAEYTESAMDLSHVGDVQAAMRSLAEAILLVQDEASLDAIRRAAETAQHFYVEGLEAPHPFHNTVDVEDFVSRLAQLQGLPDVVAAARNVQQTLPRLVFAEHHLDPRERAFDLDWIDVRNAHGLSMYMPTTPPWLRDRYTLWSGSRFAAATGWDRVIEHLTADPNLGYQARSIAQDAVGSTISRLGNGLEKVANHLSS